MKESIVYPNCDLPIDSTVLNSPLGSTYPVCYSPEKVTSDSFVCRLKCPANNVYSTTHICTDSELSSAVSGLSGNGKFSLKADSIEKSNTRLEKVVKPYFDFFHFVSHLNILPTAGQCKLPEFDMGELFGSEKLNGKKLTFDKPKKLLTDNEGYIRKLSMFIFALTALFIILGA